MPSYDKSIVVPPLVADKNFFKELEELLFSKKLGIKNSDWLSIRVERSDKESISYKTFKEFISDNLPRDIAKISVVCFASDYRKKSLTLNLSLDSKDVSRLSLSSGDKDIFEKAEKEFKNLFDKFKSPQSWVYSLYNFPFYIIVALISSMLLLLSYQIFSYYNVMPWVVYSSLYLLIIIFLFISSTMISWLYPMTTFELVGRITDHKKTLKKIFGAIILGLLVNAIWFALNRAGYFN